jgi:peptidoglycan/LPS O-acetylase OafA/YrhL
MPSPNSDSLACTNGHGGIDCGYPEVVCLAVAFWLAAIVSVLFLISNICKSRRKCFIGDQTVLFWAFIAVWQIYRGIIALFDLHWSRVTYRVFVMTVQCFLWFIAMCLVILILFELLFTYRNPGPTATHFFEGLFAVFLFAFLVLGLVQPHRTPLGT